MSDAMDMYDWIEGLVMDLIKEYQNQPELDDIDRVWNHGALEALETLLVRMNEE